MGSVGKADIFQHDFSRVVGKTRNSLEFWRANLCEEYRRTSTTDFQGNCTSLLQIPTVSSNFTRTGFPRNSGFYPQPFSSPIKLPLIWGPIPYFFECWQILMNFGRCPNIFAHWRPHLHSMPQDNSSEHLENILLHFEVLFLS